MMKKHLILIIICSLSFLSFAQYNSTKLKMAEGLLEEDKKFAALQIYEDIANSQGDNKEVFLKIAQLHEQLFNYEEASKWYYKLFEIQRGTYPKSEFKFAEMKMTLGGYQVALEHFSSFIKTYRGEEKSLYLKLCKNYIQGCKNALKTIPDSDISVKRLPKSINSSYTDLAPFAFENKLYYSTILSDSVMTYTDILDSAPTFQIYRSEKISEAKFGTSELFIPEIINKPYYHTSNGSFSLDGKKFFFTRCKKNSKGNTICKIYCSEKKDSTWSEAILLNSLINDKNNNFSSTHPIFISYLKRGQKRDTITQLIFASNMEGGYGGYDLWISSIDKNLSVGKPENLGRKVNSLLDELTPFYYSNEKTLYFSSNGHAGFGGLDIFKTELKNGRPKKISTLNNPINTSWDDWYYSKINKENAFIVSNRLGAQSYFNKIRLDDIFLIKKETKKYLSLFAKENNKTGQNIKGVTFLVKIANNTKSSYQYFQVGQPFQIIPNKTYEIIAQKNGYFNERTLFSTSYKTNYESLEYEFKLQKIDTLKGIILTDIYFDFNTATLKSKSKRELNKLYKLLILNPSLRVEIGAHTDSDGSSLYNMKLSIKRAEVVVKYLIEKGIGENVLKAKGYGKSKPIYKDVESAKNRRIVFKVINENNIND